MNSLLFCILQTGNLKIDLDLADFNLEVLVYDNDYISVTQAVIEANIILPLVHLLQHAEFDIKKEAAWAVSNATSGGTHEQIQYVFLLFCFILPFCFSFFSLHICVFRKTMPSSLFVH